MKIRILTSIGTIVVCAVSPLFGIAATMATNNGLVDLGAGTSWLLKFQTTPASFTLNSDNLFNADEEILNNSKYQIIYQGSLSNEDVFSIHVKSINRYYELRVPWAAMDRSVSTKTLLKTELAREIVAKFESEMVFNQLKEVAITTSGKGGKGVENINSGGVSFRSSWGVSNSDSASFTGTINMPIKNIEQKLNNQLKHNEVIESIGVNQVQVLPLVAVDDPPINNASFNLSNFTFNNTSVSLPSFSPILPSGSGQGSEWWHGVTSSLGLIGSTILTLATGGLAAPTLGFGVISSGLYSHATDDGRHSGLTPDQQKLLEKLAEHHIDYSPNIGINSGINVSFSGTFKGSAAATAIFGNNSHMSLDDIVFGFNLKEVVTIYAE